jgi:Putative beta-barrel porin-2, OmpL-like. bbp2
MIKLIRFINRNRKNMSKRIKRSDDLRNRLRTRLRQKFGRQVAVYLLGIITGIPMFAINSRAQQPANANAKQTVSANASSAGIATKSGATEKKGETGKLLESSERERLLLERIDRLEQRLAELESRAGAKSNAATADAVSKTATVAPAVTSVLASENKTATHATTQITDEDRGVLDFFRDTTFNITLDGYYGYNFNKPVGRINLLRAYDVSHNSFSLNQAAVVIERAPNVEAGRRFGLRLDLQYGQATETLQGSAANELRPQVYRPVWQAIGTYIAPVGNGLTVDFGKFASSLGYETNYTKDNFNYSRSYFFNFLPFYHFGFRAKYPVNDKLAVMYHIMNGTQQSEDFNHFKSQHVALILTPTKRVTWQVNYYAGREQRNVMAELNPTFPSLPTQPGLPTVIIRPSPKGRFHVFDTYVTLNATDKLTFAAEADYVINRVEDFSAPSRVTGGVAYVRYQFTPVFALAGRAEYLSDRGGLFSGVTQALKETTLTADFKLAEGFVLRGEWRRDFSNQEFFLTDVPGVRKTEQNTATVGLVWWFGRKQGSW